MNTVYEKKTYASFLLVAETLLCSESELEYYVLQKMNASFRFDLPIFFSLAQLRRSHLPRGHCYWKAHRYAFRVHRVLHKQPDFRFEFLRLAASLIFCILNLSWILSSQLDRREHTDVTRRWSCKGNVEAVNIVIINHRAGQHSDDKKKFTIAMP